MRRRGKEETQISFNKNKCISKGAPRHTPLYVTNPVVAGPGHARTRSPSGRRSRPGTPFATSEIYLSAEVRPPAARPLGVGDPTATATSDRVGRLAEERERKREGVLDPAHFLAGRSPARSFANEERNEKERASDGGRERLSFRPSFSSFFSLRPFSWPTNEEKASSSLSRYGTPS